MRPDGASWEGEPGEEALRGAVVVGVSLESGSSQALRWAWEEAQLRQVALRAVTAWRLPLPSPGPSPRPGAAPELPQELQAEAQRALEQLVRRSIGEQPSVLVEAIHGRITKVLAAVAEGASMVVLGPPHPGRAAPLVGAGRASRIAAEVECPVVMIPPPRRGRAPEGAERVAARAGTAEGS